MKRYYFFLLLLILPLCAWSQENRAKHELSLSAALMTNLTYETRLSYLYQLNNIVGIGASVGRYKQFHAEKVPNGEVYNKEWNFWQLAEKDEKLENFFVEPAISVSSPSVMNIGKWSMKVEIETGLIMQLPWTSVAVNYINTSTQFSHQQNKSNTNMQWCFWDVRPSFRIERNGIFLAVGYELSNFDVFSSYRNIKVENRNFNEFYPKRKLNNAVFLKVGGIF